jgi:hypothetical protein
MMKLRLGWLMGAFTLVGCGGNVVFSEDGEGGNGGTTTNTTTTITTNQGGSSSNSNPVGPDTSVTNVTTGPNSTCDEFCAKFADCVEGSCIDDCFGLYAQGCTAEADQYLQCLLANADCDFGGDVCQAEVEQLSECLSGNSCFTKGCSSGGNDCFCDGNCNGNQVSQSCFSGGPEPAGQSVSVTSGGGGAPPPPGGGFTCDCFINNGYVGSCNGSPDQVCGGIEQGCCAQIYF